MKPKTVLVPLDGSSLAEEALAHAIAFAREGATLVLVRAADAYATPFTDPAAAQIGVVQAAEVYLSVVADRLCRVGVTDIRTSVHCGAPVSVIADAAESCAADLIVMSTHGRSGLGRLVLGSVAEGVVRATSIPILLLRPRMPARLNGDTPREAARV